MTDYAATASQPILQGLITVDELGVPHFTGLGVSAIARTLGGQAAGDFTLTLDRGVPGDVAIDPGLSRTLLTVRGSLTNVIPGSTTIDQTAMNYLPSTTPGVGTTQIRVLLSVGGVGTDPIEDDGDGCEIVVWRSQDSTFTQTIIGPLYQPVTFLP